MYVALINNRDIATPYQLGSWPSYASIAANGKIDFNMGASEYIRFNEAGLFVSFLKSGAVVASFQSVVGEWKLLGDIDTIQVSAAMPVTNNDVIPSLETITDTSQEVVPVVSTGQSANDFWWWLLLGGSAAWFIVASRKKEKGQ